MVPLLLLLGYEAQRAVGTSFLAILVISISALVAHNKLDNLTAIIDFNRYQVDGATRDIMNIEPVAERWSAFGWHAVDVDGHGENFVVVYQRQESPSSTSHEADACERRKFGVPVPSAITRISSAASGSRPAK